MISFKEFNLGEKKYVYLTFSDETILNLDEWVLKNNICQTLSYDGEPGDFKWHVTVIYSNNTSKIKNVSIKLPDLELQFKGFDQLGVNRDIPVALVDADWLQELYKKFINLGLKSDFPEPKFHISLTYDRVNIDTSLYSEINFPLEVNQLHIEKQ